MAVDPLNLTPRPGAGAPVIGGAAPPMLRPASFNLIGGALPAAQAFDDYSYHAACRSDHSRRQQALSLAGGQIAMFGDSNFAAIPVTLVSPAAENYGISGDSLPGLITRLRAGGYSSLAKGRAIVLNIGLNDIAVSSPVLGAIQSMYISVMAYFTGPIVLVPVTPTNNPTWNANIATFNSWLSATYGARGQSVIIDLAEFRDGSGAAQPGATIDGQHWSGTMQIALAAKIAAALRTL